MELYEGLAIRASKVRMIIFDIDGVMSDGRLHYTGDGELFKTFFTRDGLGISLARQSGIKLAAITGRRSKIVATRCKELKFDAIYQGHLYKTTAYEKLKQDYCLADEQFAYIGDDLVDLPIMVKVGFAATVADAVSDVKKIAHFISDFNGGEGAVRQIIEFILKAQGKWQSLVQDYLDGGISAKALDNNAQ